MEYLDKTGLAYFWGKIKEKFNTMTAEPYKSGVNCVAGKYYTFNNKLYLCTKNTDGTIPVTNTTYFTNTTVGNELNNKADKTAPIMAAPKASTVTVAPNANVWLTDEINTAPYDSNYAVSLITFSGSAIFDDPQAQPSADEGLTFTIGNSKGIIVNPHWSLNATNIGYYGYFNFFLITPIQPNTSVAVKVTSHATDNILISNIDFTVTYIK